MITHTFNEQTGILEAKASKVITIGDIIDHYGHLSEKPSYPFSLRVLIDCRGTRFDVSPEEIEQTHAAVKKAISRYTHIREAIVVDQPHGTVVAALFQSNYYDLKQYSFMIFSTVDAALSWL